MWFKNYGVNKYTDRHTRRRPLPNRTHGSHKIRSGLKLLLEEYDEQPQCPL